jgi:hypothetical protein
MADDDDENELSTQSADERRGEFLTVAIPLYTARTLRPAAAKRDTTVTRLITDIVEVVATDNLTSAVLDDQPKVSARYRPTAR